MHPRMNATFIALIAILVSTLVSAVAADEGRPGDHHRSSEAAIRPISAGPSIFETEEHRCQTPESAAFGYRQEPHLAVNPRDARNLVAVWRQDQWGGGTQGGAALANVVAYSRNGGRTWAEVVLPGLGVCGGTWGNGASDPTVSVGSDGTAYVSAMQFPAEPRTVQGNLVGIVVYRSADGGRTWEGPVEVTPADTFNDHPTIVADPYSPGVAHLVWHRRLGASDLGCACQALVYSRSDDGGMTWSEPTTVERRDGYVANPAGLSVLRDQTLVVLSEEVPLLPRGTGLSVPVSIHASRSEDGGQTWSRHSVTDYAATDHSGRDPDRAETIDAPEFFIQQAAHPDGTIYVVWHHNTSISLGEVFASRSDDGGMTWTPPLTVARVPGQVLNPMVAVHDDGTVAVTWADLRNDDDVPDQPDDAELTTDWWIARSLDGGETWTERHISGPFDLRGTRFVRGNEEGDRAPRYWIGDYSGLVAMPDGFGAAFIKARQPRDGVSQTEVLFTRVRAGGEGRGGT